MAEIGTAYLAIVPSFKAGLGNQLRQAVESGAQPEATGKGIGSKISSGVTGGLSTLKVAAGTFIGNTLGNAFSSVIGKIGELASEAVTASDATDKFRSTLDFAGLDTSAIDRLMESTQKYADQTVYDLSDIQGITSQLAANNVKDFDRLAEAAGNLNAVAGGNKDTFKSVGMVLTQTAGQGKLTTENFNQLADAIPGASGKIQQELANMGAYTGNFRDAMAKGEISAEEFNQAILNLGFQDAAIEAATSTSTMEGAMGNLEASVVSLLKNGFDLIKPALTDIISGAADFIAAVPGGIQTAFEAMGTALGPFIEQAQSVLGPAIQTLVDKFLEFCNAVAPVLIPIFQALGEVFSYVGGIIGDVFIYCVNLVIEILTALFDQLTVFLDWMNATFGPFWNDVLLPIIQVAWEAIQTYISTVITNIQIFIDTFVAVVGAIWNAFWSQVGNVVTTIWNAIQVVIQTVMGVIQGVIDLFMGLITGNWEQAWSGIQQIGQSIWDGITGLIDIAINFVKTTIENVLNAIKGVWDAIWNGIKSLAESIWNGIKGVVEGAINAVKGVIDNVLGTIKSAWENGWNTVKNFVTTAWNGIKDGVSNGINAVVNFVSGLPGKILGALGDLGSLLINAGRSVIDGFLNGLKSAWDAVTGFIGGIGDWIASHKGPIDYDRKLLIPAGQAIMQGLGAGLSGGFEGVKGEVSAMGGDLKKEFEKTIGSAASGQFTSNVALSSANRPMTADDFRAVLGEALGDGREIAIYIDGRKVASTIANPLDAALATRQARLARF